MTTVRAKSSKCVNDHQLTKYWYACGNSYFCNTCAKKHAKTYDDFEDYARMDVVNSPRMGKCGYEGGSFNKERDGVYKDRKK